MKKTFLILMAAAGVIACASKTTYSTPKGDKGGKEKEEETDQKDEESATINLATYNVGVFNKSGVNSMDEVAAMMKEWHLDVLSLNELDSCNTRSGSRVYQLKDFASKMGGWNYNYAGAIAYKGGSYGIGAVTGDKILRRWSIKLPKSDDKEVRALSVIETERYVFCNTHLGLTAQSQMNQVAEINYFVSRNFDGCSKPVFFCGDMNAEPESNTIQTLMNQWELLSKGSFMTFSTSNPIKCIDYIFRYKNSGKCKVTDTFVGYSFSNGNPRTASDHFPVFVSVTIE